MIAHTGLLHNILFPSLLWRMPGEKIFLTFDDGPHPSATPIVLDVLKRHSVRATFFLTGKNISTSRNLVQQIEHEGHSIGIHAYNHSRSLALSKERTKEEIQKTEQELAGLIKQKIRLFRPPFGAFSWNTIAAARELGYVLVMWSCLTGDFRNWSEDKIVAAAIRKIKKGSILVFHDNDLTLNKIENVLNRTIEEIKKLKLEFGAIR